jgi:hypothetical protein
MDKSREIERLRCVASDFERARDAIKAFNDYFQEPQCFEYLESTLEDCIEECEGMIKERTETKYRLIYTATKYHKAYPVGREHKGLKKHTKEEAEEKCKGLREYWIRRGRTANGIEGMEIWHVGVERID